MQSPSPVSVASNLGRRCGIIAEGGGNLDDVGDDRDGRLLWAEQRRELREGREEAIRRGVERLRMDRQAEEVEEPHAGLPSEEDADDNEGEGGDVNGGYASASENSHMGGKGGKTQAKSGNGRGNSRKFIIFNGRGIDFFQLTVKERASKGFNFNMDCAVYDEIEGSTGFKETINPKNVADTGASRGVRLPSTSNADPEAVGDVDASAGGDDEEEGSTRGSSQTTGSPGAFGKRKSTQQQTFETMTDCMEKHGALMAATMESASKRQCNIQLRQCEALKAEVQVQKTHYAASDEVSKLMCHALLEIAKAIRNIMFSRAVSCGRGVGKQVTEGELLPKKGRHDPAKRRRGVQGGKGVVGREVESDWVDEEERQEEDTDFEEEEEHTLKRKVKQRTGGAIRIEVGGGDTAEVAHDQPQTPSNKQNQQPVGVASSSQAVIDMSAKRSPVPQPRGEAVQVVHEVADGAKAGDGSTLGEDVEALVNKLRGQRAEAKAMEVAARLWTDDIRF
ncbi:hypothetical protein CBR_g50420 [Chara braunii]|uniref:Uncharacterized protein n=1 Tax=Chara braunii TaxID=69332 RepID=A0A388M6R0_CHABU|nr:hypothetical protein CBR_g50420 [Chara braunii]|eukprot:GBG90241.1 hypothetical protein CBR_g50420 [Chara braunii]